MRYNECHISSRYGATKIRYQAISHEWLYIRGVITTFIVKQLSDFTYHTLF